MNIADDAKLVLTRDSLNHLRNSGHLDGQGSYGRIDTKPLTDSDIANLPLVFNNPDEIKVVGDGRLGTRLSLVKTIDNTHQLAVDLISNGKDFYMVTYFNKSRSPQQVQASSPEGAAELNPLRPRPERSSGAYDPSLAQSGDDVKYNLNHENNSTDASDPDPVTSTRDFYLNDNKTASELRQRLIDQLWEENKQGQGVDNIWHEAQNAQEDTYGVRVSNNNLFYSGYY